MTSVYIRIKIKLNLNEMKLLELGVQVICFHSFLSINYLMNCNETKLFIHQDEDFIMGSLNIANIGLSLKHSLAQFMQLLRK